MKNISFCLLFVLSLFTSCKKDGNTIFPSTTIEIADHLNWCEADTIICYGDSFTYGPGAISYPAQLSKLLGKPVINAGISGENALQILNRVLADSTHKNKPHVLWVGRNDNWGDTAATIAKISKIVSSLSTDDFIIITILNGDWQVEYKGDPSEVWGGMMQEYFHGLNNHLEQRFPGHVLNILPLLQANPDGSTLDSLSLVHNISLQSNRIDELHLNTKGNGIVAGGIFGMLRICKLNQN